MADAGGGEGVGGRDVGPGGQVLAVDVQDHVRPGEVQDVRIAGHVVRMLAENLAPVVARSHPGALQHLAPGAVEDHNALVEQVSDGVSVRRGASPPSAGQKRRAGDADSLGVFDLVAKLSVKSLQVSTDYCIARPRAGPATVRIRYVPRSYRASSPRSVSAACAIALSFPNADSRGRYFMPQSGASTSRSAGTYSSARRTRPAMTSAVSTVVSFRSSTPRMIVLPGSPASTEQSRPDCAVSIEIWLAVVAASSGGNGKPEGRWGR